LPDLVGPQNKDENLFADSAYKSAKTDAQLAELGIKNYIHEKGVRNRPLNNLQKELNRLKSQVRCHIEHIFGCVENSMGGPELEYIGLPRIRTGIGLSNLAYNLLRHVQLIRLGRAPAQA
jgi:IS5 family transposase